MKYYDVAIVGTGLGGLATALKLNPNLRVALITKSQLLSGASPRAQGGIAAMVGDEDTVERHISDTCIAGDGLCDEAAVRHVVENSSDALAWLQAQGVPFTPDPEQPEQPHMTREGGHSVRRIAHVADHTGASIQESLIKKLKERGNIELYEQHMAVDLIVSGSPARCQGLYVLNVHVETINASHVVLATGGAGKVYLYTTAPDGASGDGIAMAWRAGCRVSNMEFTQFHPTCLFHPHAKSFLISEAVRGEGGKLLLPDGHRFMLDHDERAELAPRDVVARAIDAELKRHGIDCVYLDITHKDPDFLREHFPMIHDRCLELGIDITTDPIPVVPAAHYTCGGVVVDKHARTDLPGLYCVGEASCTGLHGANRLASNSLLECLIYADTAAAYINNEEPAAPPSARDWDESQVRDADELVVITNNWEEMRRFMWNYMGIVRTDRRLSRAARRIELLEEEIQHHYSTFRVSRDLLEMRNLLTCAKLMVQSARLRRESRGIHFSTDTPQISP
ncbi:MAG: L-aspartate oxidase, partial [Granulosicoccaceae bacterium]